MQVGDLLPDKFGRTYNIIHCSKCFFINSCLTFSATFFQASRSWAFPCQNCFPLILSSPISALLWPAFPFPFDTTVMQWRVCRFICLQNNHSDAHYQNRCSSQTWNVFLLLNYISWQSQYYTAAHLQMHIFSRLIKTHYISKLFSYPSVEAMQRKAACLISQWTYHGQLGFLSVRTSPLSSFIHFCVSFCFEEMVMGALQIPGTQRVEWVLWTSSEKLRTLRKQQLIKQD